MTTHPGPPITARRRAFTLAEALLALALAGLVGATVLSVLGAFVSALDPRAGIREALVDRQVFTLRAGALLRASSSVLGQAGGTVVLWTGDSDGDGLPSLRELRMVEHRVAQNQVWVYESPSGSPDGGLTFPMNTDFVDELGAIAGSTSFPGRVLLRNVTQWTLNLDNPTPTEARLARLRIRTEASADEMAVTAAFRCGPNGEAN